jgi:hypothetical protein
MAAFLPSSEFISVADEVVVVLPLGCFSSRGRRFQPITKKPPQIQPIGKTFAMKQLISITHSKMLYREDRLEIAWDVLLDA